MHILVAEDDRDIASLVAHYLQKSGWEAHIAGAGDEALAWARSNPVDLIILDVMLPGLSGLEVCRALRADTATTAVPIIMLTARTDEADRVIGLELGASRRTNEDGVVQLRHVLAPYGYDVAVVPVDGCLHLKSAVTAVAPEVLLINRAWVPAAAFEGFALLDVDPGESYAANALALAGRVLYPSSFPRTRERLETRGLDVRTLEVDELAKAEGALTCCALIFSIEGGPCR